MPCTKPARGTKAGATPPFDDTINNNPCGKSAVGAVNGVDMSSHQLCVFHLGMKLGLAALATGPIVIEAPG